MKGLLDELRVAESYPQFKRLILAGTVSDVNVLYVQHKFKLCFCSLLFFASFLLISCYFVFCVTLIFRISKSQYRCICFFRFRIRFAAMDFDQHLFQIIRYISASFCLFFYTNSYSDMFKSSCSYQNFHLM